MQREDPARGSWGECVHSWGGRVTKTAARGADAPWRFGGVVPQSSRTWAVRPALGWERKEGARACFLLGRGVRPHGVRAAAGAGPQRRALWLPC